MRMEWLRQAWLETLGWTLVHSLWELSLLAAVGVIALLMLRRRSAQARYVVGYGVLMGMMVVPVGTYGYLWARRVRVVAMPEAVGSVMMEGPVFVGGPVEVMPQEEAARVDVGQRVMGWLRAMPPYAAMGYLIAAAVLTLRLLAGYGALRRVRTGAVEHEALLRELCGRLRVGAAVRLMQSARVEVPTVIGAWRPMILLPVSAMTGLSTEHLTYLLLHELAHIRRHDYLANLAQSIVETLLFYHPAVVWLSGQVRQEREHCCDDLAVAAAGNRGGYAAALASMESLRAEPLNVPGGLALGARGGSLLQRVHRILEVPMPRSIGQRVVSGASITAAAAMVLIFALYLAACSRNETATPPATQTAPAVAASQPAFLPNRPARVGDVLHVVVYDLLGDHKDYDDVLPVNEDGKLPLVFVDDIPAAGKTPRQIEEAIAHALVDRSLMRDPEVRVDHTGQEMVPDNRPFHEGESVITKVFELDRPSEFLVEEVTVDEKGDIPVRHLGRLHVAGLTPRQTEQLIAASAVDKAILRPPVSVRVRRPINSVPIAGPTPAVPDQNVAVESRTYDVADLMIQPDGFFTFPKNASAEADRAQIMAKLKQLIEAIQPDTWKDHGGAFGAIQDFDDVFLITQTTAVHAQIDRVLTELRQAHSVQISIESRIMFVDEPLYASLGFIPRADGGTDSTLLPGDTELRSLLQQTQNDPKTIAVSTPRLTLFNGQAGVIQVGQGVVKQTPGIRLNFEAAASADRRSVVLHLGPSLTQPGMAEQKSSINVMVPDGATLLMGGFTVKPSTDKSDQRRMIVLVRPKIIITEDSEKVLHGPPSTGP